MTTSRQTTRLLFSYSSPDGCHWDTDYELSMPPDEFKHRRLDYRKKKKTSDVQPVLRGLTLKTAPDVSDSLKAFYAQGSISHSATVAEIDIALGFFHEWKHFIANLILELGDSLRIRIVDQASAGHEGVTADEREALARIRQAKDEEVYTDVICGYPGSMPEV